MDITEEVARRQQTLKIERPERAYEELRDLLEDRISFGSVHEDKYFNDVDKGVIRARLNTSDTYDKFTSEQMKIYLTIDSEKNELDIQIKAMLVTNYPEKHGFQKTVWYYAYRSLFDKFLYGKVRHGYTGSVEDKLENLMDILRETFEA